jgi:hypothetical protein
MSFSRKATLDALSASARASSSAALASLAAPRRGLRAP